jgi:hypothetical protein
MQLPRGSINPFFPSHLDSSRPKLSGYSGFPPTIVSPFFETHFCFFKADDGGFASRHGLPPRRKIQRKNDLNSYRPNTSYTLAENSQNIQLLKDMQAERIAKEAEQMEEAKRLLQLSEMRNLPYDPKADGFVFSTAQIHAAIDRDRRLKHTADPEFGRMNGRQRRKLRQMMSTAPQTKAA